MLGGFGMTRAREFGSYALLNACACLILAIAIPHVARDIRDVAEFEFAEPLPRSPNLVEKRMVSTARGAPSADRLARLPATSLPTIPLSDRADVLELVSETSEDAVPLAGALDAAESLPVKPLKQLHKPRFRALYADLTRRDAQRKKTNVLAQATEGRTLRAAQRSERTRKREIATLAAERGLSAGTIAQRNISNSLAYLTP